MKDCVKEMSDTALFFKEWCNATKMRKWLKDKQNSENLDLENEDDLAKFKTIMGSVISKAEFLVKLEKSTVFQSINPSEDIYEALSYRIPSYARDHKKDVEELKIQEELMQSPE